MQNTNGSYFLKSGAMVGTAMLSSSAFGMFSDKNQSNNTNSGGVGKKSQRILGAGKHSLKVNYGMGLC